MRTSGHNLNLSHSQLRQQHRNRHPAQNREPQTRSRRRPQSLRRPRISAPARRHHPSRPKRLRRPHNRPHIPRILHRSHHHHQRRIPAQTRHQLAAAPRNTSSNCHAGCRNSAATPCGVSVPATDANNLSVVRITRERGIPATLSLAARKIRSSSDASPASLTSSASASQSRPQRILHQLRPLHANRLALRRPRPAQSRAKYLQPLILAAGNQLFTQVLRHAPSLTNAHRPVESSTATGAREPSPCFHRSPYDSVPSELEA